MKYISLFAIIFLFTGQLLFPQRSDLNREKDVFFFDAVVFKSDKNTSDQEGRIDVFIMIPAQTLEFSKLGGNFNADFSISIMINDSLDKRVIEEHIRGGMSFEDYFASQGGSGEFKSFTRQFFLPPGTYNIKLLLIDNNAKKEYVKSRVLTILDFSGYDFALSGMMLLSSIEEKEGRYIITPHISDNVAPLKDGFFVFFESYNNQDIESVDFVYEFINFREKIVHQSPKIRKSVDKLSRNYLKINKPQDLPAGTYTLQVIALKKSEGEAFTSNDYLAIAQRSIKFMPTISGHVMTDINTAVRQLRYVAEQSDLDFINSAETLEEKQRRFEQFWRRLDPSPDTERNEAFDDYYVRVSYANSNFRSYNEGWLTDKGMVYIIFGQPLNMERYPSMYGDNRVYEKWVYRNNREFIFVDNTGFGDYRLVRPITVTEKYEYNK